MGSWWHNILLMFLFGVLRKAWAEMPSWKRFDDLAFQAYASTQMVARWRRRYLFFVFTQCLYSLMKTTSMFKCVLECCLDPQAAPFALL